ncbi:MAG: NIPSNAP family protein [Burkholderiales bacterium]|nr:NIPSNAP family protein [Burkholderiales bacterium]
MFYELRIYTPAAGRLDDLVKRVGSDMVPFFERHGFAPRLGQWTAVAGETMAAFVWLLRWPSMDQRAAAFADLGADAEWQALRVRTNGAGEMVKRYDLRFLAPAKAWLGAHQERQPPASHCPLVELRVHPIAVGRTDAANTVLADVDLPALVACGASPIGAFDNIAGGPATPGVTMLLGWSGYGEREQRLAEYARRPDVVAARLRERERWAGEHVVGDGSSMLLLPTRFSAAANP